jgi:O-antigen/teichoic acid export membrane protein
VSGGLKFVLIPFFILHYGMFCYGHLMVITGLFGAERAADHGSFFSIAESWEPVFWLAVAAIFLSHLLSFVLNFVGAGEYRRTSLPQLMRRPYGRIVALHLAVIFGAALTMWLGSPVYLLVALVVIKITIDLKLHGLERQKFSIA